MDTKLLRTSVACATLGFGLTQIAGGQTAPDAAASKDAPTKAAPAPVAAKATIGVTIAETQLVATGYRASKLLRQDVFNEMGEKIGTVDDLVISTDGNLSTAIVNVGGFLGIGKHLVAIPVRQFTHIAPKAVLPKASKSELKALPKFEYTA